ncbi:Opsin [Penicillium maclennaniae]|uniref:Opsin n=1 Tax=Penicillium maclennaniae TaxID=1343394 RepID=UPI002541B464|nr:Opsin [Penicillium maclennaniae]KAJ5681375.1 Opsin [Penicillium maclennaniae]
MMVPDFDNFPALPTSTGIAPIPTVVPGSPLVQELGDTGKRTLWVVTALMAISSVVFYFLAARAPLPKRVLHTTSALITTISFITYLALSTGQGIAFKEDFSGSATLTGQLAPPLLFTNFALISGLPGANLLAAIAANYVMLAAGLLGTFAGHTKARWAWLTLSCIGYLTVLNHAGFQAQRAAQTKDAPFRRFFGAFSGASLVMFALFPITIAAGSLALKVSVDTETVLFAILDIFTQGIVGYWLLLTHDTSSGLTALTGFWAHGIGGEGNIRLADEEGA